MLQYRSDSEYVASANVVRQMFQFGSVPFNADKSVTNSTDMRNDTVHVRHA